MKDDRQNNTLEKKQLHQSVHKTVRGGIEHLLTNHKKEIFLQKKK